MAIDEMYSMTGTDNEPAKRDVQVRAAEHQLEKQVAELLELTQRLGERLGDAVLRPSEPKPDRNGSEVNVKSPDLAPLAGRLYERVSRLSVVVDRLHDYIERLEV